jgi:nucleobase:cation symporter-1, NCS1 family
MIATMGNQIAAGAYPFGNDISALAPRYINIRRAVLFMAVFCIISNPWSIIVHGSQLLAFLSGYACFMGPIAGIVVSDFYLIRNMKLDIRDMYDPDGKYRYFHGWNWRAWLTFSIAVGPILPGFAQSINPNLNISIGAEEIYTFSWAWGFVTCVVVYYVICKYISPPVASLSEVAVFPPRTEEEEELQRQGLFGNVENVTPSDSGSVEKVGVTVDAKMVEDRV